MHFNYSKKAKDRTPLEKRKIHPPTVTATVNPPYRAELLGKKIFGEWRKNVEEAMSDAKKLGSGSRVISKEGVVLARFENAINFRSHHGPGRPSGDPERGGKEE